MSLLISLYMRYLDHFKHDVLIKHNVVSILNETVNKSVRNRSISHKTVNFNSIYTGRFGSCVDGLQGPG